MKHLLLLPILLLLACSETVAPYSRPPDLAGDLTECAVEYGRYYITITPAQSAQVSAVYTRWSVGTLTHRDGTSEPIWTYWQTPNYEVGKEYVTIPVASVSPAAAHKEYLIRF